MYSICPLDKAQAQPEASSSLLISGEPPLVKDLTAAHEREVPGRFFVSDAAAFIPLARVPTRKLSSLSRREVLPVILVLVAGFGKVHAVCLVSVKDIKS